MVSKDIIVSISCITYNHAPYIRQCLDGFLMQKTDFAFEVLIHDDCSTDGTTEIIKEYEAKYPDIIKPLYEEENQYQQGKPAGSAIWNFPRAKGKYIAMCEGDDYWTDPLKLQKQVDFLEKNLEFGIVYAKVKVWSQEKGRFWKYPIGEKIENYEDLLVNGNRIPTLSVLFRKSISDNYTKDIVVDPKWKIGDFPLWLYISHSSKIKFLDDLVGVYRMQLYSASSRYDYGKVESFYQSSYNVMLYFNDRFKGGYKKEIDRRFHTVMFVQAFRYNKWADAVYWYNCGISTTYKNRIKMLVAKNKSLHFVGIFFNKYVL